MERIDADVAVVGAGYAGLTAARRLAQAGATVVVLEARDRVGGRVWTRHIDDGTALDIGGTWLAPDHTRARDLARELGVGLYPTFNDGAIVFTDTKGKRSSYSGLSPKISPLALAQPRAGHVPPRPRWRAPSPWRSRGPRSTPPPGMAARPATGSTPRCPTRDAKHLLHASGARAPHRRSVRDLAPPPSLSDPFRGRTEHAALRRRRLPAGPDHRRRPDHGQLHGSRSR